MAGPARYLAHDEQIVLHVRHHIAVLFKPLMQALAVILIAVVVGVLTSPQRGSDPIDTLLGLGALFFGGRFLWRVWEWWVDRIVITDRRIYEVSGLLTRRVATMPLAKMTDMTYERTVLGRVLGYGDLIIESAGQSQALNRIPHLPRPDDIYRTISSLGTGTLPRPSPRTVEEATPEEDDTGPLPRIVV